MALQTWLGRTTALALALLCGFALLGEIALRSARFNYPYAAPNEVVWSPERDPELLEQRLYQLDDLEVWKPVPGAELPWAPGEHLDSSGFRSDELPRERTPGVLRIAILGSDEALGVGLPRALTWPTLLRQELEAQGRRVEILCAAVEGTTLRQGLERWRQEVRPYHPNLVLCTYAGEMESRAANGGCTDDQRITSNCGRGSRDASQQRSTLSRMLREVRVFQSCAFVLDVLSGKFWNWRASMRSEQHLRAFEEGFEVPGVRRVPWRDCGPLVEQWNDELARDGVKLLCLPITGEKVLRGESAAVRGYQGILLNAALSLKIGRLSVLELFQEALAGGARVEDFYTGGQLNERGQRLLATEFGKVLGRRWADLGR